MRGRLAGGELGCAEGRDAFAKVVERGEEPLRLDMANGRNGVLNGGMFEGGPAPFDDAHRSPDGSPRAGSTPAPLRASFG